MTQIIMMWIALVVCLLEFQFSYSIPMHKEILGPEGKSINANIGVDTLAKTFPVVHYIAGKSSKGNIPEIVKAGNRQKRGVPGKGNKKAKRSPEPDQCRKATFTCSRYDDNPPKKCCDNLVCLQHTPGGFPDFRCKDPKNQYPNLKTNLKTNLKNN